jgi:hypothetical protein
VIFVGMLDTKRCWPSAVVAMKVLNTCKYLQFGVVTSIQWKLYGMNHLCLSSMGGCCDNHLSITNPSEKDFGKICKYLANSHVQGHILLYVFQGW